MQKETYKLTLFKEHDVSSKQTSLGKVLEIHKFTWPFISLLFGLLYNNYSFRMMLMHSLYGGYGLSWVLKSNIYPDKNFYFNKEHKLTIGGIVGCYMSISVHYLIPYIAATNYVEISKLEIVISNLFYIFGLLFHHAADCQKFYQLKYNPGKLITDGFFFKLRHPNYTGEFMLWISFLIISGKDKFLSYIPFFWVFVATILAGMPAKEKSLKRYDEYNNWKNNTYALIPFIY